MAADSILAWEDDPGAPMVGTPVERPVPVAPAHGLATALRTTGTAPKAGKHILGSDAFSQIAAHMLEADHARFQGRYLEPLRAAFVRHGVLSLESTLSMNTEIATMPPRRAALSREAAVAAVTVAEMSIDGHRFGLGNRTLLVQAPTGQKRFAVAAAAPSEGSVVAPSPTNAVTAFLEDLFRLGRVTLTAPTAREGAAVVHPFSRKTHKLTGAGQELTLTRQCFACGLT